MIAYLEGKLAKKTPTTIIVDVNGVGYNVNISLNTYAQIENLKEAKILTHMIVKEDSNTLYGFLDEAEKLLFGLLLSVKGVGGNTARVILSYMTPEEVKTAILHENTPAFNKVKGVGPKTAKQIMLDLKDKVAKIGDEVVGISIGGQKSDLRNEVMEALRALGFQKSRVEGKINAAIASNPEQLSVESIIKEVLKQLS